MRNQIHLHKQKFWLTVVGLLFAIYVVHKLYSNITDLSGGGTRTANFFYSNEDERILVGNKAEINSRAVVKNKQLVEDNKIYSIKKVSYS